MRVSLDLSAVPDRPAGAGRYALELARGLSGHLGNRLHLVTRESDGARWLDIAPQAYVHALVPKRRPLRLMWEQTFMVSHLARLGVDVHIGPHYTLPERANVAKVATIHDMFFFDNPEWHERSKVYLFRRAIKAATRVADQLVAVSEHTENSLRARFGDVPVSTIPLGVDHDRFNTDDSGSDASILVGSGIDVPFVCFVGTIEPRKNVAGLLRAFDKLASTHDRLSLVIAGKVGWKSAEFEATLEQMTHRDRVVRLGYVPDATLRAVLRSASAVAYPSFAEGFGLPALEALACGAALVTTSDSAMAEVTGDAAVLVDAKSDASIADGLEAVLAGGESIERMRAAGPAIAAGFTWERTVDAHLEVLERAVARRR